MKFYILITLFALCGCQPILKWQTNYPDNQIEEMVEEKIKNVTGYDLDLTPVTGIEKQEDLLKKGNK